MSSYFSFLAMAGDDYQDMVGIRGTNNVFQDYLRQGGVIAQPTVAAPGWQDTPTSGFTAAGTYWLKLEKEGDTYFASWSADGETFTELFRLEGTGIEADYIVIDAYKTSTFSFGGDNNWLFTLKNLELEGGEPTVQLDKKAIRAAIREAKAVPRRYYLLAEDRITEQLSNQMVQDEEIELLSKADATPITYEGEAEQIAGAERIAIETGEIVTENNASPYDGEEITSYVYPGSDYVKATGERYTKGPSGNPTVAAIKVFDAAEGKETIEELARPEGLKARPCASPTP